MKKVKITILKTMLNKELAEEYGVKDLKVCPMMKEGQIFYADYSNQKDFVMKHGKLYINMLLLWLMALTKHCFIMGIG